MIRKKVLLLFFLGITAIGLICGILFGLLGIQSSSKLRSSQNTNKHSDSNGKKSESNYVEALSKDDVMEFNKKTIELEKEAEKKTYSDPTKENYVFSMLAVGDWGSTLVKEGKGTSCCNRRRQFPVNSQEYNRDKWAQESVAALMALAIKQLPKPPKVIIGHGDNFYWNGIGPKDQMKRFDITFEQKYKDPAFNGIPWVNVMGNHDYGGDGYICGDGDNQWRPCKSKEELLDSLENRFLLQAEYRSPNQNRWLLPKHYYKYQVKEANVTVDIFNVDTNIAASHGARQICCQCYGYSKGAGDGPTCTNADRGQAYCLGGNTDWYDACYNRILQWHDESYLNMKNDATASTADFKVVNSHYSPTYHFIPDRMMKWYKMLEETKTQIFLNGHTHAESHDHGKWGTHFFENGAGGGIQTDSPAVPNEIAGEYVKSLWTDGYNSYGFFLLHVSKSWTKVEFMTFDSNWSWANNVEDMKPGGIRVGHCWYIPHDGSIGREC